MPESKVKIGVSSKDTSLNTLGLMPSGPAALEMFRACRSFKTPLSVTWISGMSFSWLDERLVNYLQRAEISWVFAERRQSRSDYSGGQPFVLSL